MIYYEASPTQASSLGYQGIGGNQTRRGEGPLVTFYDLLKGDPAMTTAPRIANLLRGLFYSGLSIQAFPNQASPTSLLKRLVAESVDSTRRPYSNVSNQ